MSEPASDQMRWTTADLERIPAEWHAFRNRRGSYVMTRAPDLRHRHACLAICHELDAWAQNQDNEQLAAPELVIEMLSLGGNDQCRDHEVKLPTS